jgi:hypothetical protein
LDKFIPTTKLCPKCQTINKHITLKDRIFKCGCGYEFDRDVHSAKNMLVIKNLVLSNFDFVLADNQSVVPTEHREITLVEFKTSIDDSNIIDKSEC